MVLRVEPHVWGGTFVNTIKLSLITALLGIGSQAIGSSIQAERATGPETIENRDGVRIFDPFTGTQHGWAYSPIPPIPCSGCPNGYVQPGNQALNGAYGQLFDSDMANDDMRDFWGQVGNAGRMDLRKMSSAGANIIKLYDYNWARGNCTASCSFQCPQAGDGHLKFLDACHQLGIKVVIPISNYNLTDGWGQCQDAVNKIVASVRDTSDSIHPAVHSFAVGNEIDLNQDGVPPTTLMPRAVQAIKWLHAAAPNHRLTSVFSAAYLPDSAGVPPFNVAPWIWIRENLPANIYQANYYNSLNVFKPGFAMQATLESFDTPHYNVPLLITEYGSSSTDQYSQPECPSSNPADRVACMVERTYEQCRAVDDYIHSKQGVSNTNIKGYCVFTWEDKEFKGGSERGFGTFSHGAYLYNNMTGSYCGGLPQAPWGHIDPQQIPVYALTDKANHHGTLLSQITSIWGGAGLRGDANGDGTLDQADVLTLLDAIGSGQGDANFDGVVDVNDLLFVIQFYGMHY